MYTGVQDSHDMAWQKASERASEPLLDNDETKQQFPLFFF
jgi:hypothetical protein